MMRRFTIEGFKRFERKTAIDLEPVTVLVGANNSGKSTVLQALNLFQYCVETTRKANGESKNGRQNGRHIGLAPRTVSPEEFGALPVADPADLWPQGRAKKAIRLTADFDGDTSVAFELSISFNRFSIRPTATGDVGTALRDHGIRLVPIFSGFLPQEEYLTPPARSDRIRLQRHGEVVRNLLWELRENARPQWTRLQELLGRLFPESAVQVEFNIDIDRFIRATYHDGVLTRDRDVITAGSGFHQALQILASVLAPGAGVVLLDEPDAHLHARMQGLLMDVFRTLAEQRQTQFVIATHSPHLLGAAPPSAVRVCMLGRIVPFSVTPEQLQMLDQVGAIDRMELIPLLSNRVVVFVENKRDRKLLEHFARKLWGEKKAQEVFGHITFLYTYQEPASANVLSLARQVRDLIAATGTMPAAPLRMLAIGDRDYRTDAAVRNVLREHKKKARTEAYKLESFDMAIWQANEIENYLLDREALLGAVQAQVGDVSAWSSKSKAFEQQLENLMASQREPVRQEIASRIQRQDRRLDLSAALRQADEVLAKAWGDGLQRCDAKALLAGLRTWLQQQKVPAQLADRDLVDAMRSVPDDVQRVLKAIQRLARPSRPRRRRSAVPSDLGGKAGP